MTFSSPLPSADYRVAIAHASPGGMDNHAWLVVGAKTAAGFTVDSREKDNGDLKATKADINIDWIAIASK